MDTTLSGVGVVDKTFALLAAVEDRPASLADLVDRTGISRPTAHRLATALEVHGALRRDGDGRFVPGLRLVGLGRAATRAIPLADLAMPILAGLRDETGESAQLYVREGERRVCVAAVESAHGLRTIVPVGASLELGRGSAGHLLSEESDALAQGWTQSSGEREPGVASVSAPVLDPDGRVIAAISLSGPIDRLGQTPGDHYATVITTAAQTLHQRAFPKG